MTIPRFFIDHLLEVNGDVQLPQPVSHHAVRVLRLQVGAPIILFNGQGGYYEAQLSAIRGTLAQAKINQFIAQDIELPRAITIAQGLVTSHKMDWVVEKAVELGAYAIQPLDTERCVVQLQDTRAEKRRLHWQTLAQAACEQCGRNQIPTVYPLSSLKTWLEHTIEPLAPNTLKILLSPGAPQSLISLPLPAEQQAIYLLIGPEGGLTSTEEMLCKTAGFIPVHIGPRIVRTETAAATALAMLAASWHFI